MSLRTVAAAALSLSLVASVAAAETGAMPADKLFPFLQTYYSLPAGQRDHFQMAFFLAVKGGNGSISAVLKRADGDVPISIASNGRITPIPTADDLKNKRQISLTASKGSAIGVTIKLMPTITPAATLDAAYLAIAVTQAHDGAKKAAGIMSLAVPDYKSVCFEGVTGGTIVLKSGQSQALKTYAFPDAQPCFTPSDAPTAFQIKFERAPSAMTIVPKPK